jgi:peptidoglycan/xylan/chitin deacetylase (PgdA/CDA1 family)
MGCKSAPTVQSAQTEAPATKLCALTFDDGPNSEKTPLVLDKLEKYGVVASFFMVGQNFNEDTKPVIDRIVKMKCEINNHGWSYNGMNQMSPAEIKDDVAKTSAIIKEYSGQTPRFFRAPNLAASEEMYENVGLPFCGGVLGMDWAGCGTSAEDRANNVLREMKDGSIILLHDTQPYPHPTPEALDILIPELKKQGYEFVTVSELFRRKGVKPDPKEQMMWNYVEKE